MPPLEIQLGSGLEQSDLEAFSPRVFEALALSNLVYRKPSENDAIYFFGEGAEYPTCLNTPDLFSAKLHRIIRFTHPVPNQATHSVEFKPLILRLDIVKLLYYSEDRRLLPPFEIVLKEPAVYLSETGIPTEFSRGYDRHTESYFLSNPHITNIRPLSGVTHLTRFLSGVPFAKPCYLANVVAYLLGALVYARSMESPLLAITGNQPGIGKTKLATAIGYILTGSEPAPVSVRNDEMNKQIGARFHEGNRFLLFDNITTRRDETSFQSEELAKHLTSGHSKKVRELGHSRSVAMRGVQFCLTANHCALHEDLKVRAMMVKLHREHLGPMAPYVLDEAYQYRKEIYGELLGLALSTPPPLVDGSEDPFFRYRSWASFVKPRVVPHFGRLDLALGLSEMDPLFERLCEYIAAVPGSFEVPFTAGEFLTRLQEWSDRESFLREIHGSQEKNRARSLSTKLQTYLDKPCTLNNGVTVTLRLLEDRTKDKVKIFLFDIDRTQEEAA